VIPGALALTVAFAGPSQLASPVNLRVLPKDTSAADVKSLMEQYNQDLGVTCDHCHSTDIHTRKPDYASDDNPAKQTARLMIAMLNEINTRYIAQLDDQKYVTMVTCGNCHQGQTEPPEFIPRPRVTTGGG